MSVFVPVPSKSYSEVEVTLEGITYLFTYRFNSRAGRWKLDISLVDGTVVVNGLSLLEGTFPTAHLNLEDFNEGLIGVIRITESTEVAGRSNLGIGKDFVLAFSSYEEILGSS